MGDRPVRRPLSLRRRLVATAGLLPVGAAAGISAVALHGRWWGMVLGLAATAAVLWVLPDRWWGRLPFGLAWTTAVVGLAGNTAEGDYLIASDGNGYTLLGAGLVVLVVALISLRPRRTPQFAEDSDVGRPAS